MHGIVIIAIDQFLTVTLWIWLVCQLWIKFRIVCKPFVNKALFPSYVLKQNVHFLGNWCKMAIIKWDIAGIREETMAVFPHFINELCLKSKETAHAITNAVFAFGSRCLIFVIACESVLGGNENKSCWGQTLALACNECDMHFCSVLHSIWMCFHCLYVFIFLLCKNNVSTMCHYFNFYWCAFLTIHPQKCLKLSGCKHSWCQPEL